MVNDMWNDPERVVAFWGSIISFVSILVNIFQAVLAQSLKNAAIAALNTAKNAFNAILNQTDQLQKTHPADRESLILSIQAHAERGKDQIENVTAKVLK